MLSQAENNTPDPSVNQFIAFCDGLEQAGMGDYAQRGRVVARELQRVQAALESARSALAAVTADRDRWRDERWRAAHGQRWP